MFSFSFILEADCKSALHFCSNLGHFHRHLAVKRKQNHAPPFKASLKSSHPVVEKKQPFHEVRLDVFESLAGFHTPSPMFHVCHT